MSFFDSNNSSDIVGLVFICLIGVGIGMCFLGCIVTQCNCACENLFWQPSDAQKRLIQQGLVDRKKLRVGAHRGGSINAHENSLGAFASAARVGAGLLELDLNLSKDQVPIVSHDFELERVIDPEWLKKHPQCKTVSDCDSKDLPPYASQIRLHFPSPTRTHFTEHGSRSDWERAADATAALNNSNSNSHSHMHRFCTLQEFLDFAPPDCVLHIDIKQPSSTLVRASLDVISKHPRSQVPNIVLGAGSPTNSNDLAKSLGRRRGCDCCHDQSCASCGSCCVSCCCCACCSCGETSPLPTTAGGAAAASSSSSQGSSQQPSSMSATEPLLQENTRPLLFANIYQVIFIQLAYFFGLLPYMRLPMDVYSIPAPTTALLDAFGKRGGADSSCCAACALSLFKFLMTTPKLWGYLRQRGVMVIGWVLNDEQSFAEAAEWPLDGVMTDDVPLLVSWCDKHPQAFMV